MTNFALVQFERIADDHFNEDEIGQFFIDRVKNIVGKGENTGNQHFLLFPQCFQKASLVGVLKISIVWV